MFHINTVAEKPELPLANVVVVDVSGCDVHK